jgi:hypothetical protein
VRKNGGSAWNFETRPNSKRNPKSNLRNPKEIRNPNAAIEHFQLNSQSDLNQTSVKLPETCNPIAGLIPTLLRREFGMITVGGGLHFAGSDRSSRRLPGEGGTPVPDGCSGSFEE